MTELLSLEHITEVMEELRAYQGRTIVIKIGGNSIAENSTFLAKTAKQIAFLNNNGVRIVLIHGGGPQIDDALRAKNIVTAKGKDGRRITSPRAMQVVAKVMKATNLQVAQSLLDAGCRKDQLLLAAKLPRPLVAGEEIDDDPNNRSGKPGTVNAPAILRALSKNKIVVLHSLGAAPGLKLFNINGDDYAMAVAIALKAKRLILVTNVQGVLDENRERIPTIDANTASKLIKDGTISGGMVPKVESALWVVRQGVGGVAIIDGFRPWAILAELLTHEGLGTLFRSSA